jgi:hypothetical protein
MKFKIILAALFLVFAANYSFGQTANDFEKKYGSAKYYEIRPYILVSPVFDKNRQVCRAEIRPATDTLIKDKKTELIASVYFKQGTQIIFHKADTNHLFPITVLNSTELKEVFDELIPVKMRKGKGNSSVDFSGFGARYTTTFRFENITIKAVTVPYEKAVYNMEAIGGNLDLFLSPLYGAIESANIVWTERTCVEN